MIRHAASKTKEPTIVVAKILAHKFCRGIFAMKKARIANAMKNRIM